jgi:hypothetical protein
MLPPNRGSELLEYQGLSWHAVKSFGHTSYACWAGYCRLPPSHGHTFPIRDFPPLSLRPPHSQDFIVCIAVWQLIVSSYLYGAQRASGESFPATLSTLVMYYTTSSLRLLARLKNAPDIIAGRRVMPLRLDFDFDPTSTPEAVNSSSGLMQAIGVWPGGQVLLSRITPSFADARTASG